MTLRYIIIGTLIVGLVLYIVYFFDTQTVYESETPAPVAVEDITTGERVNGVTREIPKSWVFFEDSVIGYRIRHPDNWFAHPAESFDGESSIESFIRPLDGTEGIPDSEIKVVVRRFSPEYDMAFAEPIPEQVVETRSIKVAGQKATWRRVENLGTNIVINFQYKGDTYVIVAIPSSSDYIDDFDLMLSTFAFIPHMTIETPLPTTSVRSPFTVRGEAPGNWFFEGSMTADLLDENDNRIAQTNLVAQGDWMTTSPVVFEGELSYGDASTQSQAIIVIRAANPSGLAENEKLLRIPVQIN